MSYQQDKFTEMAEAIRLMQGGATDNIAAVDFAEAVRALNRDTLPWQSTVALTDNTVTVTDTYHDVIDGVTIYGACEQDGTPTPDVPVEIRAVSGSLVVQDLDGNNTVTYPVPTLYGTSANSDTLIFDRATNTVAVNRVYRAVTLDGTHAMITSESDVVDGTYYYSFVTLEADAQYTTPCICNYFPNVSIWGTANIGCAFEGNMTTCYLRLRSEHTSIDALSAWLAACTAEGYPVYAVIPANTTTETLDYIKLPTFDGGTIMQFVPDAGAASPAVEVSLKTKTEHTTQTA